MVSVGGLTSPVIGVIADATSLRTALTPLILMPALSWVLVRALPEPAVSKPQLHETARHVADSPQVATE
jgi:FSR family fosmidomycin resistance protein-like MFS transporter